MFYSLPRVLGLVATRGFSHRIGVYALSIPFRMEKAKQLEITRMAVGNRWANRGGCWLALLLLAACSRPDAEERLRTQLQEMQQAASEGRVSDFMDGVSEDFTGNRGGSRTDLHNLLRLQVLGRQSIGVATGPVQVELRDSSATVRFSAVVSGGSGRLLPDSAQAYTITSGWRDQGGTWRVYYAEWKPQL